MTSLTVSDEGITPTEKYTIDAPGPGTDSSQGSKHGSKTKRSSGQTETMQRTGGHTSDKHALKCLGQDVGNAHAQQKLRLARAAGAHQLQDSGMRKPLAAECFVHLRAAGLERAVPKVPDEATQDEQAHASRLLAEQRACRQPGATARDGGFDRPEGRRSRLVAPQTGHFERSLRSPPFWVHVGRAGSAARAP